MTFAGSSATTDDTANEALPVALVLSEPARGLVLRALGERVSLSTEESAALVVLDPPALRARSVRTSAYVVAIGSGPEELEALLDAGADDVILAGTDDRELHARLRIARQACERRRRPTLEDTLLALEARFGGLLAALDELIFVNDAPPTGNRYLSPACERITGLSREDLYARPARFLEIVPEEERAAFLQHALAGRDARHVHCFRIVRPTGEEAWLSTTSFPVRDERGSIVRHIGICKDITAERRAIEESRRQSSLLSTTTRVLGTILRAPSYEEVLDECLRELAEASGTDLAALCRYDEREGIPARVLLVRAWHPPNPAREALMNHLAQGMSIGPESQRVHDALRSGRTLVLRASDLPAATRAKLGSEPLFETAIIVPVMLGGRCWGQFIFADSAPSRTWSDSEVRLVEVMAAAVGAAVARELANETSARRARHVRALYEAANPTLSIQEQLRATLEAAVRTFGMDVGAIYELDRQDRSRGTLRAVHPESFGARPGARYEHRVELFADPSEAARQETFPDRVPAALEPYGLRSMSSALLHVRGETWGRIALFSRELRPSNSADQDALELLGRWTSLLLERERADEEREGLEARMQRAEHLESLGLLAGGIAHDFNNLLMAMLGNAELALLELPADSRAQDNLLQIASAARRAGEITQQMLAYTGQAKTHTVPIELDRLTDELGEQMKRMLPRNVRLIVEHEPGVHSIEADPGQIRLALVNLIRNAADVLDAGDGVVRVRTLPFRFDERPTGQLVADGAGAGEYAAIEVIDQGPGLAPEVRARMFEPFFTTRARGRGLGLAAVAGIVRTHRGVIQVDSEPGRETTFRAIFPTRWRARGSGEAAGDDP